MPLPLGRPALAVFFVVFFTAFLAIFLTVFLAVLLADFFGMILWGKRKCHQTMAYYHLSGAKIKAPMTHLLSRPPEVPTPVGTDISLPHCQGSIDEQ